MSAVLCTYTAGYFLWTIYHRHRHSVFGAFDERKGWLHFLWKDLCHAIAMYWILLMVRLLCNPSCSDCPHKHVALIWLCSWITLHVP